MDARSERAPSSMDLTGRFPLYQFTVRFPGLAWPSQWNITSIRSRTVWSDGGFMITAPPVMKIVFFIINIEKNIRDNECL